MRPWIPALVGALALVAGCGGDGDGVATSSAPVASTAAGGDDPPPGLAASTDPVATPSTELGPADLAAATDPPTRVPEVLDVVAPTVGGGELDLASLAGRAVALWFWAPT